MRKTAAKPDMSVGANQYERGALNVIRRMRAPIAIQQRASTGNGVRPFWRIRSSKHQVRLNVPKRACDSAQHAP